MMKIRKLNENGQAAAYARRYAVQDPNSQEGKRVIKAALDLDDRESVKFMKSISDSDQKQYNNQETNKVITPGESSDENSNDQNQSVDDNSEDEKQTDNSYDTMMAELAKFKYDWLKAKG